MLHLEKNITGNYQLVDLSGKPESYEMDVLKSTYPGIFLDINFFNIFKYQKNFISCSLAMFELLDIIGFDKQMIPLSASTYDELLKKLKEYTEGFYIIYNNVYKDKKFRVSLYKLPEHIASSSNITSVIRSYIVTNILADL